MSQSHTTTPRAIVTTLAAIPKHRERLLRLRQQRSCYDDALIEEFRRRAEETLRLDPREAVHLAQLGLLVAEALRADRGRVACLVARAKAAVLSGSSALALASVDEASRLARGLEDSGTEAEIERLRVQTLIALERYDDARACCESTLLDAVRRGDVSARTLAHMTLADIAFRMDRPRAALVHYAAVDRLLPPSASAQAHGALALNRAIALDGCNRFRAAERHFQRARDLFEAAGCEHTVAQVDYNIAYHEFLHGRPREALLRYASCEPVFRGLGDGRHLAHIELDRAEIFLQLNRPDEAAAAAAAAEKGFRSLGIAKERAQALFLTARAAELSGRAESATASFERAERQFAGLGLTERAFSCLLARAGIAERRGELDRAEGLAALARGMLRPDMNPLSAASLEVLLARIALARGDFQAAVTAAESVLDLCRRVHAPTVRIEALRIVGRARFQLGERDLGAAAFRSAAETLERFRGGLPPDEWMSSFLSGNATFYEEAVETHVLAGEPAAAFEYAERSKARALVDMLAGRRRGSSPPSRDGSIARRLRCLRERLDAVYERLSRSELAYGLSPARFVEEGGARTRHLEEEVARLLRRRRLEDRETTSLDVVDAPTAAEVRETLEPGTAILQYFLTSGAIFAFAVTSDAVHVVRHDLPRAEVCHLVDRSRFHVLRGLHARTELRDPVLCTTRADLANLADLLLQPLAPHLDGMRRLVIVPQSELHHVPFHALPWQEGWLCDQFEVLYAPSAAVYGFCRDALPTATGPAAVFGLPDELAEDIERESREVAATLGDARLYLGAEATFERLREEAGRARLLHVATHGMFRRDHPMLSSMRLADRWVNLYDLYDLTIRGELVVLSSCESGTADADRANEIVGLTRGLLHAGAPAVLTSQWRVDDVVTSRFMECFHRALREGCGAATAHRRAMAAVREEHPHPYYWAAFFLTGCPTEPRGQRAAGGPDATPTVNARDAERVPLHDGRTNSREDRT